MQLKKLVGNKIFTATFQKKDGTIRNMNCRLGVVKHLRGGGLSYDPASRNNLIVYDLKKKGYRTINLDTLISIRIDGKKYNHLQKRLGGIQKNQSL